MKTLIIWSEYHDKEIKLAYNEPTDWTSLEALIHRLLNISKKKANDFILYDIALNLPLALSDSLPDEYRCILRRNNDDNNNNISSPAKRQRIGFEEPSGGKKPMVNTCTTIRPSSSSSSSIKEIPVRWGHTMTKINDNLLMIIGGDGAKSITHQDVWIYDDVNKTFNLQIATTTKKRAWHSATYLPNEKAVFVFGGEYSDASGPQIISDPMLLDTNVMLWYPPKTSGVNKLRGRSGHTATLVDMTKVFIYGGSLGSRWTNEVLVLDTEIWQWSRPKTTGDTPPPTSYHSCVLIDRMLVVFGGNGKNSSYNDIYTLNVDTMVWEKPIVLGKKPTPRAGHIAVNIGDGTTMMLQGGWDPMTSDPNGLEPFSDSYVLNTKTWIWSKIENKKHNIIGARVGHTCCTMDDKTYVFGGAQNDLLYNDLFVLNI